MPKAYQECIKELAKYVREELQQVEELHSLSLTIDVSGRVHDGELKIEFMLGSPYNTGGQVIGGDIEAIINEYLRRFGWDQRNRPLELSFSPEETA